MMEKTQKLKPRRQRKIYRATTTTSEVILCAFRMMPEWPRAEPEPDTEKKAGRYHGSFFGDVPSYGRARWAVLGEIDVDFSACVEKDMSEREVVEACVNYLNLPPARKKYAKREPQPPYGSLELYKYYVKERNEETKKTRVQILLLTDQRKNKNFWREGISR